jgi:hypothetical protein
VPSTPHLDRTAAVAIYLVAAALLGVVIAVDVLPAVAVYGLIAVDAIASVLFRQIVLHEGPWSTVDLMGALAFIVAYLPLSLLVHHWPFN